MVEKVKRLKEIWKKEKPTVMDRFLPILVDIESGVWFDPDPCTSVGPNGILRKWGTKEELKHRFTETTQLMTGVWLCRGGKVVRKTSLYQFLNE